MKKRKVDSKLEGRINFFEKSSVIQEANRNHPGTYKKPGSRNYHKN